MMERKNIKVSLVIMASGLGTRFGGNKLMANLEGKPLVQWTLDATGDLFDKRVVVTRNKDVQDLCDKQHIECILHTFPGRNDTIRLGLSALMKDVDYCFFALGDQPLITRDTMKRLVEEAQKYPEGIVRTSYEDVVGNPVGFSKIFFKDLLTLPTDQGGSYVIKQNLSRVQLVPVQEFYEIWDVDTNSDLEKIKKVLKSSQ